MKISKLLFVIVILLSVPHLAEARLGGSGAQFLALGGGSRPLALGGAYTALAEGVESIYWNPAGLARLEAMTFSFTHAELFADMNQENVAFATPALGGVVGLSAIAFLSGEIEITTVEEQEGTGEKYSANDFAVGISYARMMTDKFTAGVTLKLVNQNIHEVSAYGWALDLGGTYNTGLRNLRLGFVIQNFGPDLRYSGEGLEFLTGLGGSDDASATYRSEPYPLPLSFQVGLAYDIINFGSNRLTALVEGVHPTDQSETFAMGVEYCLNDIYSARLGYTERNNKGFSGGLGVRIPLENMNIIADYSYESHEYLDALQRFTIGFKY